MINALVTEWQAVKELMGEIFVMPLREKGESKHYIFWANNRHKQTNKETYLDSLVYLGNVHDLVTHG